MSRGFIIGAGGEGLPVHAAVLHVTAPSGSTVSIAKGGVTVKTLDPGKAHSKLDGMKADYYFPIFPANYGEWTVTAVSDTKSADKAVTISANQQYDVELVYELALYEAGNTCGYPWKIIREDVSSFDDPSGETLLVTQNGNGNIFPDAGFLINQKMDLSAYSSFCAHITRTQYAGSVGVFVSPDFVGSGQFYKYLMTNPGEALASTIATTVPSDGIVRCDISSLQGQAYVNVGARCSGHVVTLLFEVDHVWLE